MSLIQAADTLCPQWGAIGIFALLKENSVPDAQFLPNMENILKTLNNKTIKNEISRILPKIERMSAKDCLLYYESIENVILELINPSVFQKIFDLCISNLYDSLSIACELADPSRSFAHERSPIQPAIVFPDYFFPHIERSLSFLYKIIETQKITNLSEIHDQVHNILYDLCLQAPENFTEKRFEGKIYSTLSADPNWFSAIFNRINILSGSLKQKEGKKAFITFLQNLKFLRNAKTDSINELIAISQRIGEESSNELISFIALTCMNSSNIEINSTFVSSVSKLLPTKKFDYRYMKALIRLFYLDNRPKPRFEKLGKLLKSYQKTGYPDLEKLCILSANLMCPAKFPVDQYVKEMKEMFFKKGKSMSLAAKNQDVDLLVEVFSTAATKDIGPVADFLKPILSTILQMKDQIPMMLFSIKLLSKILPLSKAAASQLIASISPSIPSILSSSMDKSVIESAIPCIPAIWVNVPKGQEMFQPIISDLFTTNDVNISLAVFKSYTRILIETQFSVISSNLTTTIPTNVASRIDQILPQDLLVSVINQFSNYFEAILCYKDYQKIPSLDKLLLTIDTAMFPFLFYSTKPVHSALHHLYTILIRYANTYFLGTYFLEHKDLSIQSCYYKNEDWFCSIYTKAAEFWVCMNRFENREFTDAFLKALFSIARATKNGRKIEITTLFLSVALEYMYKWKKEVIIPYLQLLHPSVWQVFFNEYEKLYQKYNGQPWKNFLFIQTAFISNRHFSSYNGPTTIFDETLTNYINNPRSKLEKDIPYEILTLNVISSYIRKKPNSLIALSKRDPNLISTVMKKVDTKELFVINEPFIFAFLDFIGAILGALKLQPDMIKNATDYIITIAEKSPENSSIQYAVNECLYAMFKMNQESRSMIFKSALSSRKSSTIGWAILRSGMQLTRSELTQLFVLAMSIFQTDPNLGIYIAKMLVGDREKFLINPLSEYDIETENKIWQIIEKTLSDDEIFAYTQLLADSVEWVRKRQKVSLFFTPYLEQNANVNDFETVFSVISQVCEDSTVLLPLQKTLFKIFSENKGSLGQMFDLMFSNDSNYEAAAFVSQIAFKACPQQVSAYLLEKLRCFSVSSTEDIWTIMKDYKQKVPISSLSLILALVDNSIKYFEPILAQIVLYSLFSFESQRQEKSKRVPPLLFSLMHQLDLSIESFSGLQFNSICTKLYTILKKYSPTVCDKFESILIPKSLPSHCFSFVKEISPLISPAHVKPLINLIANYAINDNINSFLTFVPIVISRLNNICDAEGTSMFINFILSFMYENGHPRLMGKISASLPRLLANKCVLQQLDENIVLMTAVAVLLSVESLKSPTYLETASFLKSLSQLSNNKCLFTAYEILQNLWGLSGFKISEIRNINDLAQHVNKAVDPKSKKNLLRFLFRFTSSNIIQDFDFKLNIVSFVVNFLGEDFNLIKDINGIDLFLLLSSICNDVSISSKYAKLLARLLSIKNDAQPASFNVLASFGPTVSFRDVDNFVELRMVSPNEIKLPPPESVPNSITFFKDYFSSH